MAEEAAPETDEAEARTPEAEPEAEDARAVAVPEAPDTPLAATAEFKQVLLVPASVTLAAIQCGK
jgi:hypothetical protein